MVHPQLRGADIKCDATEILSTAAPELKLQEPLRINALRRDFYGSIKTTPMLAIVHMLEKLRVALAVPGKSPCRGKVALVYSGLYVKNTQKA